MVSQSILVPVIVFCSVIGFLIGAVMAYFLTRSGSGGGQAAQANLQEREKRYEELFGMWRERAGGKLHLWFGGKMVVDSRALSPVQRRRLEDLLRELLAWLSAAEKPEPVKPPEPSAQAAPPPITPEPNPAAPAAVPPPSTAQAAGVSAAPAAAVVVESPKEKASSIVEQINDILKDMVVGTELESKSIHLAEDPRKGVVVYVGLERFDGVDMVTYPEVKAALRSAAAEWERRMDRSRR